MIVFSIFLYLLGAFTTYLFIWEDVAYDRNEQLFIIALWPLVFGAALVTVTFIKAYELLTNKKVRW